MAQVENKAEKPEAEKHLAAAEPLINREAAPTVGKDEMARAQATMDKRMDDDKLNLPHDQLSAVKGVEAAFLGGDRKALLAAVQKYSAKPADGEGVMNTVLMDLTELGVQASWDYSEKGSKGKGKGLAMDTASDIGNLSFYKQNEDGSVSSVTYSTDGKVTSVARAQTGLLTPTSTKPGGKPVGGETADAIFSAVRASALKSKPGA